MTQDVSDEAIAKEAFHLPKDKREAEDSKLGRIQKENATAGMEEKFDVMVHQSTYSGGGESKRSANQSVSKQLTSIVQLAKAGKKHCLKYDLAGICVVSEFIGENGSDPTRWWKHNVTDDLWTSWEAISEERALAWQYTLNKRGAKAKVDRQSDRWLMDFLENSCTLDLKSKVDKELENLQPNRRGGIIYIWTVLTTMFDVTRYVKKALLMLFG